MSTPPAPDHPGWDADPDVLADYLLQVDEYVNTILTPDELHRRYHQIRARIADRFRSAPTGS